MQVQLHSWQTCILDVCIRNFFEPSQIINAANEAGVAAKFGESEKGNRHDNNVTAAGCLFHSLVVETYGVWSTHSLEVIKFIAKRSSLLNGKTLSKTLATCMSNCHAIQCKADFF